MAALPAADLYVGNDATPILLFVNRGDGRFDERGFPSGLAVSGDGNEQASMGVDAADYDNDGRLDVYGTHFASDYSTLYRNLGGMEFEDVTARALIRDTAWVSWGTRFVDLDHDGWKDIVKFNGHVYPHLRGAAGESYEQPALTVYRNGRDGTFRQVLSEPGSDAARPVVGRGAAFADFDNDGDVDVLVACLDSRPLLLRNDQAGERHWLMLRTLGRRSNRDGIGARVSLRTGALEQVWEQEMAVVRLKVPDLSARLARQAVEMVQELRTLDLRKSPSISETLDWARALVTLNAKQLDNTMLETTLSVLLKNESDLQRARRWLQQDDRGAQRPPRWSN